ncbi:hypothetical protein SAMN05660226_01871 [Parapedobacter luteus]|uniref:Outer membrane protein beta-barrel domain-containing protein n=1 Tax=Parapedobacter luteus TaxID=623280 RepID=A0A1T5C5M2_9SPHI|nr:hypothetical protein [Parapedobacter luteus]SKB54691.1 hypothetical protein SAMN05660226_01871 [Parapedobacter luteus]
MKKTILILSVALMATGAYAQSFQKGTSAVNAGVGFGTNLGGLGNARPAVSVSYEYGNWEVGGPGVISLGGYIGNTGYRYRSSGYTQRWNYTVVGARSAYHYNGFENVPNLDVYGGLMLAYNIASYKAEGYDGPNTYGSGLGFSAYLGGRWFFSNNIGLYTELGFGVSVLNAGITFKL